MGAPFSFHLNVYLCSFLFLSDLLKKRNTYLLIMSIPFYVFQNSIFLVIHSLYWNFHQIFLQDHPNSLLNKLQSLINKILLSTPLSPFNTTYIPPYIRTTIFERFSCFNFFIYHEFLSSFDQVCIKIPTTPPNALVTKVYHVLKSI